VICVEVIAQEQSDSYGRTTMIWKIWRHWLIFIFSNCLFLILSDDWRRDGCPMYYDTHSGRTTQECLQVQGGIVMNIDDKNILLVLCDYDEAEELAVQVMWTDEPCHEFVRQEVVMMPVMDL